MACYRKSFVFLRKFQPCLANTGEDGALTGTNKDSFPDAQIYRSIIIGIIYCEELTVTYRSRLDDTSKFRTVTEFVILDFQQIWNNVCRYVYDPVNIKFHIPISDSLLDIAVKPKENENFLTSSALLLYILQKGEKVKLSL
jgi:hypothetical protein